MDNKAYLNGVELLERGALEDAQYVFSTLLVSHSDHPDVVNGAAICWIRMDNNQAAYDLLYKTLKKNIFNADLLLTFANLLFETNEFDKSLNIFSEGNRIYPNNENFIYGMALNEDQLGNLPEALNLYNQLIELNETDERYFINRSSVHVKLERYHDAVSDCAKAIEINPDNIQTYKNKASALVLSGDIEQASACYREIIRLDPHHFESYYNLSGFEDLKHYPEILQNLTMINDQNDLDAKQYVYANFALSKYYDHRGDFSSVWMHLKKANDTYNDLIDYNPEDDRNLMSLIKSKTEDLKTIAQDVSDQINKNNNFTPIFILGMPRSGTSLVEQIISAHPDVVPYGENIYFPSKAPNVYANASRISSLDLIAFQQNYLQSLSQDSKRPFFTDKHPLNFKFIGLISLLFPSAKIIDVRRSPQAVCWSNYKHFFVKNEGLQFSFNLENIVHFYHLYEGIMRFWMAQMPHQIYQLDYDKLTENKWEEIRNLQEFIGLNFNEACLYPEKNKNIMKTASRLQVTKPIYKGSSDDWKNYQEFLADVFVGLSE